MWNWRQLPGVTCAQGTGPMPKFTKVQSKNTFVGGITDGQQGCAVLDYNRDGVSAKKAWFFAGDQIVCLGAGIRATEKVADPISTTANQCLLRGPVRVCIGKEEKTLDAGTHHLDDVAWVEHDGVRYHFPEKQAVVVRSGPQTGNWRKVQETSSVPKADQTKDVFCLWVEHGTQPTDGSSSYIIQPTEQARKETATILRNTEQVQAVRFGEHLVQAVFHAAGTLQLSAGLSISVMQPCLLLLDDSTPAPKVWVADPTQTLTSLVVTVGGKTMKLALPIGGEMGKSAQAQ